MTTDDDGMEAVVRAAREERDDPWADPRWERLADGTISAADRAALEALASKPGPYADAMAAFAPLSATFKARVADELVAGSRPLRAVESAPAPTPLPPRADRRTATSSKRSWRAAGAAVATLAAAAAFAVAWLPTTAELPPLPGYALDLSDGAQGVRGDSAVVKLPEFFPTTTFELIARPASPTEGAVAAVGVLVGNGVRVRWTPPFERSADGALRVRGPAGDVLPVGPGDWALTLVVGRPGEVDRVLQALELSDTPALGSAKLLTTRVRVSPARP